VRLGSSPETTMRMSGRTRGPTRGDATARHPRAASPPSGDYDAPMGERAHRIELHLDLADDEQVEELERALLKARAGELSEVRRRTVRLTAGYGDATTRGVMDDESRRAQLRHDVLSTLIEALRTRTER
jgi:hypothetical protein